MERVLRVFAVLITVLCCASPSLADETVAACTLVSDAEIRQVAGEAVQDWWFSLPRNGSALAGGGSECEMPGFTLQLDAAPVSEYSNRMKAYEDRTQFEPVGGIGDEAHYYLQDSDEVGVYARVARHMFVVSASVPMDQNAGAVRPRIEAMAKLVASKLK
jgi:hypothetical protein